MTTPDSVLSMVQNQKLTDEMVGIIEEKLSSISPPNARKKPYLMKERTDHKLPDIKPNGVVREDRVVRWLFISEKGPEGFRLIDFQVPMKCKRNDKGWGKIDLLAQQGDGPQIVPIEVKFDWNNDSLSRAVAEILLYARAATANWSEISDELQKSPWNIHDAQIPHLAILATEGWWEKHIDESQKLITVEFPGRPGGMQVKFWKLMFPDEQDQECWKSVRKDLQNPSEEWGPSPKWSIDELDIRLVQDKV